MKERPIIFGAESVRAILAGTKTQTRRVVRNVPDDAHTFSRCEADGSWVVWCSRGPHAGQAEHDAFTQRAYPDGGGVRCPYGVPGDRLWVRETWRSWDERCDDGTGAVHDDDVGCGPHCSQVYVAYAATPRAGYRPRPDRAPITYLDASTPLSAYHESLTGPWSSPILMPRWASRLLLEVTAVRVERLQDITEDDARAEGIAPYRPAEGDGGATEGPAWNRIQFSHGWDALNEGRGYAWSTNPWVWVITFRRLEPPALKEAGCRT